MTNYNDGKWHGWNGGECPVHPLSEVEAVCTSIAPSGFGRASWKVAGEIDWASGVPSNVIAFRVVKEHREPREFWANEYSSGEFHLHPSKEAADNHANGYRIRCIRVREVL